MISFCQDLSISYQYHIYENKTIKKVIHKRNGSEISKKTFIKASKLEVVSKKDKKTLNISKAQISPINQELRVPNQSERVIRHKRSLSNEYLPMKSIQFTTQTPRMLNQQQVENVTQLNYFISKQMPTNQQIEQNKSLQFANQPITYHNQGRVNLDTSRPLVKANFFYQSNQNCNQKLSPFVQSRVSQCKYENNQNIESTQHRTIRMTNSIQRLNSSIETKKSTNNKQPFTNIHSRTNSLTVNESPPNMHLGLSFLEKDNKKLNQSYQIRQFNSNKSSQISDSRNTYLINFTHSKNNMCDSPETVVNKPLYKANANKSQIQSQILQSFSSKEIIGLKNSSSQSQNVSYKKLRPLRKTQSYIVEQFKINNLSEDFNRNCNLEKITILPKLPESNFNDQESSSFLYQTASVASKGLISQEAQDQSSSVVQHRNFYFQKEEKPQNLFKRSIQKYMFLQLGHQSVDKKWIIFKNVQQKNTKKMYSIKQFSFQHKKQYNEEYQMYLNLGTKFYNSGSQTSISQRFQPYNLFNKNYQDLRNNNQFVLNLYDALTDTNNKRFHLIKQNFAYLLADYLQHLKQNNNTKTKVQTDDYILYHLQGDQILQQIHKVFTFFQEQRFEIKQHQSLSLQDFVVCIDDFEKCTIKFHSMYKLHHKKQDQLSNLSFDIDKFNKQIKSQQMLSHKADIWCLHHNCSNKLGKVSNFKKKFTHQNTYLKQSISHFLQTEFKHLQDIIRNSLHNN